MKLSRILITVVVFVAALPCRGDEPNSQAIYQSTLKASAWVVRPGSVGRAGQGTGFVVDRSRRWLITNAHVVGEANTVRVLFAKKDAKGIVTDRKLYTSSESIRGRVLGTDPLRDIAVVELDAMPKEVGELKLAAKRPNRGERVYQIGNPGARNLWESNAGTVTVFTSQQPQDKTGKQSPTWGFWMRDDRFSGKGYSGGPVVNAQGQVVGVTTRGIAIGPEFFQALPPLCGLLASVPTGPLPFLACAPVKTKSVDPLAWCIDAKEIDDLLALIRKEPARARWLMFPGFPEDLMEHGLHYLERGRPDVALVDFQKAVERDPKRARAYSCRAMAYRNLGKSSQALADFEEAIRRDPKDGHPYRERAQMYYQQKKFDKTIADANEAIRRESKDGKAQMVRGLAYARTGEFVKAGDDFKEAVRLAPTDPGAHNALAWHLSTCPEDRLRDGLRGLEHATRACELSHWKNPGMLDTLAAAHAECGRFSEAVKWQTQALELATKRQSEDFRRRLQMYQSNQPYRQGKGDDLRS